MLVGSSRQWGWKAVEAPWAGSCLSKLFLQEMSQEGSFRKVTLLKDGGLEEGDCLDGGKILYQL